MINKEKNTITEPTLEYVKWNDDDGSTKDGYYNIVEKTTAYLHFRTIKGHDIVLPWNRILKYKPFVTNDDFKEVPK
jgi:hypothetical protein